MSTSERLRLSDVRRVFDLVGECRELGFHPASWRTRLADGLCRLVGDCFVLVGEIRLDPGSGPGFLELDDNGPQIWGASASHDEWNRFVREAPLDYHPVANRLFSRPAPRRVERRRALMDDGEWYRHPFFERWIRPNGVDDAIFAFQAIPGGTGLAVSPNRFIGDRPFSPRDARVMSLLTQELGRHLGRSLVTARDPMGRLAPRLRATLELLLEGDGEKQAAARLGIRPNTIREYVQAIYRHFGVGSRAELMACFLRRSRLPGRPGDERKIKDE